MMAADWHFGKLILDHPSEPYAFLFVWERKHQYVNIKLLK